MIKENYLNHIDRRLKYLVGMFIVVLSIGFFTGISFVNLTTSASPSGVTENYLGNEDNEQAEEMKFKKSKHEMLNILHTHFLSLSMVFFMLGLLVYGCHIPSWLKSILLLEPMISVLVTFGGIYLVWSGVTWMSFIVLLSGALMTISFTVSVIYIIKSLIKPM